MLHAGELIKCYRERGIKCYIVYAILVILERNKTVFNLGKIFLSDEGIIPFERYHAP